MLTIRTSKCNTIIRSRPQLFILWLLKPAFLKPSKKLVCRQPVWSKFSSCPLPHPLTSLQAQVHDKSGSVDPLFGPDRKTSYISAIARDDSLSLPLRLHRLSLVVLQQTAQPLPTPHRCLFALLVVMHYLFAATLAAANAPQTESASTGIPL
jgi:hypothetical protein